VQLLTAVDHREERPYLRTAAVKPATNSVSWSSVRTDSVVGISGTSSTSAACMTFSETSEMLGGQSRNTWSYSAAIGLSSWASLRVGFLSAPPRSRSMLR
jgi:hypothetical protein